MNYKVVISIILFVLVQIFIIQNIKVVEIQLIFWTIEMSRALLMFSLLFIGAVIGWLLNGYVHHRKKSKA